MTTISELNIQAGEALGRIKPSERRLLAGLAVVVLAVAPIKAASMKEEALAKNEEAQAQLDRAHQTARRSQGGISGKLATERGEVRSWSWTAETAEVGKVLIQDRIANMAEDAGLSEIEVKLNEKAEQAGEVQLVPLELTAVFSWSGLSAFLAAMDASGKGFVLDSVQMPDSDKPRLKVNLRAPLVVTPAAVSKDAT